MENCYTFLSQRMKYVSLALMVALPMLAGANDRIGHVEAVADTLYFYPQVSDRQISLTVAGESIRWQESIRSDEIYGLSLSDRPLADGLYTYELIASPDIDQSLLSVAQSDRELVLDLDQLEQSETYRQVGQFTVSGGEIRSFDQEERFQRDFDRVQMEMGEK